MLREEADASEGTEGRRFSHAYAGTMSVNDARQDPSNRDSRLSARKTFPEEKRIMDIVKAEAAAKCKDEIKAFAECAQANNIFVIFNCREQNRQMNACCNQYTTEAHIDAVRQRRVAERAAAAAAAEVGK